MDELKELVTKLEHAFQDRLVSVILYGSGLSDGNLHTNNNLPLLLIGGAATQIKGGRFIQYPAGTPMANLYLTLLDKLGVKMDNLGDSTGKLDLLSVG